MPKEKALAEVNHLVDIEESGKNGKSYWIQLLLDRPSELYAEKLYVSVKFYSPLLFPLKCSLQCTSIAMILMLSHTSIGQPQKIAIFRGICNQMCVFQPLE